jgi:hypothetical protein
MCSPALSWLAGLWSILAFRKYSCARRYQCEGSMRFHRRWARSCTNLRLSAHNLRRQCCIASFSCRPALSLTRYARAHLHVHQNSASTHGICYVTLGGFVSGTYMTEKPTCIVRIFNIAEQDHKSVCCLAETQPHVSKGSSLSTDKQELELPLQVPVLTGRQWWTCDVENGPR